MLASASVEPCERRGRMPTQETITFVSDMPEALSYIAFVNVLYLASTKVSIDASMRTLR